MEDGALGPGRGRGERRGVPEPQAPLVCSAQVPVSGGLQAPIGAPAVTLELDVPLRPCPAVAGLSCRSLAVPCHMTSQTHMFVQG